MTSTNSTIISIHNLNALSLSQQTNIDSSTILRLINGNTRSPRADTINELAEFFGVSPDEFYDKSEVLDSVNIKNILDRMLKVSGILNTTKLSSLSGIPKSNLDRILTGVTVNPNSNTLHKLAEFFKIKVSQLLGLEPIELKLEDGLKSVPVIAMDNIHTWLDGNLRCILKYINVSFNCQSLSSFAILINNKSLEPKFKQNSILLINNEVRPEIGDYLVVRDDDKIGFYVLNSMEHDVLLCRKIALEKINCKFYKNEVQFFGVVIQEIINYK